MEHLQWYHVALRGLQHFLCSEIRNFLPISLQNSMLRGLLSACRFFFRALSEITGDGISEPHLPYANTEDNKAAIIGAFCILHFAFQDAGRRSAVSCIMCCVLCLSGTAS